MISLKTVSLYAALTLLLVNAGGARADEAQDPSKPNNGRAESLVRTAGEIGGAIAGTAAGELAGGPRGAIAGGIVGQMAGGHLGAEAGKAIDRNAAENQRTGRGGENDPRYDPSTLFDR